MPRFAANITTLFKEYGFLERPQAAVDAGFTGIECQFPYHFEAEDIADKITEAGVPMVLFNAPPGNFGAGERGLAALQGREQDFRDSFDVALYYADALDCAKIHVMAGVIGDDEDIEAALETYVSNLRYATQKCAEDGIMILIEPLSSIENYLLTTPNQGLDVLARVDQKNLRLQYDFFHAQRTQGNLSEFLENHMDAIGHVQVAGVPGRQEPDKLGEINWRYMFDLLDAHGYDGWVGAEYEPRGATALGRAWARDWGIGTAPPLDTETPQPRGARGKKKVART